MKHALVTGSNGFVGRRMVRRLLNDGWYVEGVDDLSAGILYEQWAFKSNYDVNFLFTHQDLRDWVKSANPNYYDLIVHCAAVVGGRLKIDGDPLAVASDLAIDAALFNWVVRAKRQPLVVYFSSSAVYPWELQTRKSHCALLEDMVSIRPEISRIGVPDAAYGWSKLSGEFLAYYAVRNYGSRVLIYRPFSGYGEDQSFDYPFPSIIRRLIARENPVVLWGSGEQTRDFIYIEDIIDAVLATKDVLKPGDVLNLGSGQPTSFMDLAEMACKTLKCWNDKIEDVPWKGVTIPRYQIQCDTSKPEGVFYRVADTYKLSQFYTPKVSLGEGIRKVADHMRLTLPAA